MNGRIDFPFLSVGQEVVSQSHRRAGTRPRRKAHKMLPRMHCSICVFETRLDSIVIDGLCVLEGRKPAFTIPTFSPLNTVHSDGFSSPYPENRVGESRKMYSSKAYIDRKIKVQFPIVKKIIAI